MEGDEKKWWKGRRGGGRDIGNTTIKGYRLHNKNKVVRFIKIFNVRFRC